MIFSLMKYMTALKTIRRGKERFLYSELNYYTPMGISTLDETDRNLLLGSISNYVYGKLAATRIRVCFYNGHESDPIVSLRKDTIKGTVLYIGKIQLVSNFAENPTAAGILLSSMIVRELTHYYQLSRGDLIYMTNNELLWKGELHIPLDPLVSGRLEYVSQPWMYEAHMKQAKYLERNAGLSITGAFTYFNDRHFKRNTKKDEKILKVLLNQ